MSIISFKPSVQTATIHNKYMDYLDPEQHRKHRRRILLGYLLIGVIILVVLRFLFYSAYGYGVDKNGQIIKNGFVYVSTQPNPASIYLNNKLSKSKTNSRLLLPSGRYTVRLERDGYRAWQRSITVEGGDVQHFDYPLLLPRTLTTTTVKSYASAPGLATQSPDHRWLLVQQPGSFTTFDLYDLKDPAKAPTTVALPSALLAKGTNHSWEAIEWATDNRRVLLRHLHDGITEFVVLDRETPAQSVNLNKSFSITPTMVSLNDRKYDQYYLYDSAKQLLLKASLKAPGTTTYLDHILAYKSYGNNTVLYATDAGATKGKVAVRIQVGTKNYTVREVAAGKTYVLDLTSYDRKLYVALSSSSENRLYIYKDPLAQLTAKKVATPSRALLISNPTYLSFSSNTQFIMTQNGQALAAYDLEYGKSYNYTLDAPLDQPQAHASWMDGHRLVYVSGGKLMMLDYDSTNKQVLVSAMPAYSPFFAPDHKYVYVLAQGLQTQANLTQTALLTPADL